MKRVILYFGSVCFFCFALGFGNVAAQDSNDYHLPGKVQYGDAAHPWPAYFKLFASRNKVKGNFFEPIYKNTAKICSIVTDVPVLKPPRGFNINPDALETGLGPAYTIHLPGLIVKFCNYPLYTDKQTHEVKQSESWGSSMQLYLNDPKMLFNYANNIEEDCDSVGIPVFHFKPEMHIDKNGFQVLDGIKTVQEIRVIKKKGVPLYTPLTQKEFLEFEIKREQMQLNQMKLQLVQTRKQSQENPQNQELKDDVGYVEDNITNTIKGIRNYEKTLNSMSAEQLQAPAYTSVYYTPPVGHYYFDLVSPTYKGATELVRLNKDYFDESLPKSSIQLILVATNYSTRSASPELIQTIKTWFKQIDYEKLQSMIQ